MRSAVPQNFRSGNAARKSVMKALMSSRPLRGSWSEYFRSISGAAIASTTARLHFLVYMLPPIPRCSDWAYSSLIQPSRISLPRYGSRVGLHIVRFEILWGVDSDRHSDRVRLLTDPLWR